MLWGYIWDNHHTHDWTAETFGHADVECLSYERGALRNPALATEWAARVRAHNMLLWVGFEAIGLPGSGVPGGPWDHVREAMLNPVRLEAHARDARRQLDALGVLDHVIAVSFFEEAYSNGLNGGAITDWPELRGQSRIVQGDILREGLSRCNDALKRVFPAAYTVSVEGLWNADKAQPEQYYMPPPRCDALAIDAYMYPQAINRTTFRATVEYTWDWCLRHFPHPLVIIGHAFHGDGGMWSSMPTVEQLSWYVEGARARQPRVPALIWFMWGELDGVHGVRAYPDRARYLVDTAAGMNSGDQ
jgi:hypothetical protein